MMTLAEASSYFDRTEIFDAYSGDLLFLGQIDPYDDSKRDAMAAYRRVLSVAPGTRIPTHLAIRAFGTVWILGSEPEVDGLADAHRVKYVMQMAGDALSIGTVSEFLGNQLIPGTFGFASWTRDALQVEESSNAASMFEVVLPRGTEVSPKELLWTGRDTYLALSVRQLPSDFLGVRAVRIDPGKPGEARVRNRTYAPAAGSYVHGDTALHPALRVRWQSLFEYQAQIDPRFQEGDFTLALPESAKVDTSARIEFDGASLGVLAVDLIPGGVIAHVRRV